MSFSRIASIITTLIFTIFTFIYGIMGVTGKSIYGFETAGSIGVGILLIIFSLFSLIVNIINWWTD